MYIYIYIHTYNDALVTYFDFHPINRRMMPTHGQKMEGWLNRLGIFKTLPAMVLRGWKMVDVFLTLMIFKRSLNVKTFITFGPQTEIIKEFEKKIISHVFAHQEYQESRSKVGNLPFSAWSGLERGGDVLVLHDDPLSDGDSQEILGGFCGTREVETHLQNMWKYVETAGICFFVRCTLDMTQHRTD